MGMNVYTASKIGDCRRGTHIGKRWAAGIWCWDCGRQLKAHDGRLDCSRCGKSILVADLKFNPAMRELGFEKAKPMKHRGIDGASGFVWQVGVHGLGLDRAAVKKALGAAKHVITEYGDRWPISKFWAMFKDIITEEDSLHEFS